MFFFFKIFASTVHYVESFILNTIMFACLFVFNVAKINTIKTNDSKFCLNVFDFLNVKCVKYITCNII